MSTTSARHDTLEGKNLLNGDLRVYLVHQDCRGQRNTAGTPPDPFFEETIGNELSMKITSSTFSAFMNYGVTDSIDVGVLVPVVTMAMNVDVIARIIPLSTGESTGITSSRMAPPSAGFPSMAARRGWATWCSAASSGS